MTGKPTVNRKGKARLAPTIASIPLNKDNRHLVKRFAKSVFTVLVILLIGGIGVQTITSCSDGGSSPNGPIYSEPSNPTPSSSSTVVMGKCPDYLPYKIADAKIYDLENCTNIYEKTISCTGPSIPTAIYNGNETWAGMLCAPTANGFYAARPNYTYECGHMIGDNIAVIPDNCY